MKRTATQYLLLGLLATSCFSVATVLQQRVSGWGGRRDADSVMKAFFGEGRRLFANQFFVEADVSFHGGYYPSIFDRNQAPKDSRHMTAQEADHDDHGQEPESGHQHSAACTHAEDEHVRQMAFLGEPRDWIERFGRHFMITEHTHLSQGKEREILPWLKMSAELDPQRVDTYTVAAYWLRDLGKVKEAEAFLREGLRNNPDSYEILFELGRLYRDNLHDATRARNVWDLGLKKWEKSEQGKKEPDFFGLEQLAVNLARLEEEAGNLGRAVALLELAAKASPHPDVLRKQIAELKAKGR